MLADEISAQRFEAISRRCHEVTKHCGVIELHPFSTGDLCNIRRKPLWDASLLEYQRSERAAEASDHHNMILNAMPLASSGSANPTLDRAGSAKSSAL